MDTTPDRSESVGCSDFPISETWSDLLDPAVRIDLPVIVNATGEEWFDVNWTAISLETRFAGAFAYKDVSGIKNDADPEVKVVDSISL